MHRLHTLIPAQRRHVRRHGLLPCCFQSVEECRRPTVPGSELECPVCRAALVVDAEGAWRWLGRNVPPAQTADGLSVIHLDVHSSSC